MEICTVKNVLVGLSTQCYSQDYGTTLLGSQKKSDMSVET